MILREDHVSTIELTVMHAGVRDALLESVFLSMCHSVFDGLDSSAIDRKRVGELSCSTTYDHIQNLRKKRKHSHFDI